MSKGGTKITDGHFNLIGHSLADLRVLEQTRGKNSTGKKENKNVKENLIHTTKASLDKKKFGLGVVLSAYRSNSLYIYNIYNYIE